MANVKRVCGRACGGVAVRADYRFTGAGRWFLCCTPAAIALVTAALSTLPAVAADYTWGTVTTGFSITASEQGRTINNSTFAATTGSVYDRGAFRDTTYDNFSLSSLAGGTIVGDVNLNFIVDSQFGGVISNGVVGTANNPWTYSLGSSVPGYTLITSATGPNATFSSGQTATWTISGSTFQTFVDNPGSFNGLAVTAGAGSQAHFSGVGTLTGSQSNVAITVTEGTDWNAASWDQGTTTLAISGASTVTGGNIAMLASTTLSVTDSATLGGGSFSGSIANGGQIAIATSADQTLSGAITGAGSLAKSGGGTLALTANNTYTGATTISSGTLQIGNGGAAGSLYSPAVSSGNLTFGSTAAITNDAALVYNIAGAAVNVNRTINGTGTLSVTGDQSVNFADGTSISTGGSQTYSATATGGRYYGFNLADGATVTLTSTAGNISMTGMLGTANGNTGNLTVDTSAGNGNVALNTPTGISGVDFGLNSLTVTAGTGAVSLGTFNSQNWGTVNTISLTGGAIDSTATMTSFTALNVTNSGSSVFSGGLSGAGALSKSGIGTLTLTAANTYTGTTTVSAGVLAVQNTFASPTVSIASGATFEVNVAGSTRDNPSATTFTGTGTLLKTGAGTATWGTQTLTIAMSSGGLIDVQGGTLSVGPYANDVMSGNLASLNVASGALADFQAGGSIQVDALTGAGTVEVGGYDGGYQTTLAVGAGNGSGTFSGLIQNPVSLGTPGGALVKLGTGTQMLTGNNTYTGTTTISQGTLQLGSGGSTGSIASASIVNDANLIYNLTGPGVANLPSGSLTGSGSLSGTAGFITLRGSITQGGAVSLVQNADATLYNGISLTGANTITGSSITINADIGKQGSDGNSLALDTSGVNGPMSLNVSLGRSGRFYIPNSFTANSGTGTISVVGTGPGNAGWRDTPVTLTGRMNITAGVNSNAGVTLNETTATGTVSGALSGGMSLTKGGVGTLTLTGSNPFSGGVTINGGSLAAVRNTLGTGAVVIDNGGTLRADDQWVFSGVNGYGVAAFNPSSLTIKTGGSLVFDSDAGYANGITNLYLEGGSISGGDNGNGLGVMFLYSGNEQITARGGTTSTIASTVALTGTTNSITVEPASVLEITGRLIDNGAWGGGGFVKNGAGTLTLAGANTYTQATQVNAGTLAVNGSLGATAVSVASNATLAGSGSLAGAVNVLGTLSPGNSPGVITLGSLVLGGTSTTLIEIAGTARGSTYDGVDITTEGGLTYGGLLSLDFSGLVSAVADGTTFDIFSFGGSPSSDFSSVSSTGLYSGTWSGLGGGNFELVSGGQTLTFSQATGDIIVVPEPGTLALACLGLTAAAAVIRRRVRRCPGSVTA